MHRGLHACVCEKTDRRLGPWQGVCAQVPERAGPASRPHRGPGRVRTTFLVALVWCTQVLQGQPIRQVCWRAEKTQLGALKSHVISSRLFPCSGVLLQDIKMLFSPLRCRGCKAGVTAPPHCGGGAVGNVWRCFGGHTLGACASWLWWAETRDGAHHLTTHNTIPTVPRAIPATPRAMPTGFRAVPTTPSTVSAMDTHQPPPHVSRAGVRTLTGDLAAGSVRCLGCRRPGER